MLTIEIKTKRRILVHLPVKDFDDIKRKKQVELSNVLKEVENLIAENHLEVVEDRLEDIIIQAKRYHLNFLVLKAQETFKSYKNTLRFGLKKTTVIALK